MDGDGQPDLARLFAERSDAYAAYRPRYPAEVADVLATAARSRRVALDIGCGSGQLTDLLVDRFERVVACDASPEQVQQATSTARVTYVAALAERLPVRAACADLVVAAQAAHWFDLARYWSEARRVTHRGAIVALTGYGLPRVSPAIDRCTDAFHDDTLGAFWPPQRRYVVEGYASLPFPFEAVATPVLDMVFEWTFTQFVDYVKTWSAVGLLRRQTGADPMQRFVPQLAEAWGDAEERRHVRWPIWLRVGRV